MDILLIVKLKTEIIFVERTWQTVLSYPLENGTITILVYLSISLCLTLSCFANWDFK